MRALLLTSLIAVLALAGCGSDDDDEPAGEVSTTEATQTTAAPPAVKQAKLRDGIFNANDVADCLLDAGVGAAVSLDGVAIDLHDAFAQVIVEQGNGDILVYTDAAGATRAEAGYRDSFGDLSEVGRVRNVLWQADPELADDAKAAITGCLGV